jgi:predicted nucleic acid-binding protein
MPPFIDSNIFIRHLMADHPVQSPACRALFEAIERGELIGWTSQLVISELVFVLSRVYRLNRRDIQEALLPLLSLPGLKVERKQIVNRIFELYVERSIDYVDAYHAALLEGRGGELYSYDTDFDRVAGLRRREPG